MNKSLLWFDDRTGDELVDRIDRAAKHYEEKYGKSPDLCYVHPSALLGEVWGVVRINGIDVVGNNIVLPNLFWIGQVEAERKVMPEVMKYREALESARNYVNSIDPKVPISTARESAAYIIRNELQIADPELDEDAMNQIADFVAEILVPDAGG